MVSTPISASRALVTGLTPHISSTEFIALTVIRALWRKRDPIDIGGL